jgi:hypothetical protein
MRTKYWTPNMRTKYWTPKMRTKYWTPKMRTKYRTPKLRTKYRTPKVRTRYWTPKVRTRYWTPKVRTEHWAPKLRISALFSVSYDKFVLVSAHQAIDTYRGRGGKTPRILNFDTSGQESVSRSDRFTLSEKPPLLIE